MSKSDLSQFTPDVQLHVLASTQWDDNPAMQAALNNAARDMATRRSERENSAASSSSGEDVIGAIIYGLMAGLALAMVGAFAWVCLAG